MVKDPQTKGQVRRIVEEEENVNYERRLVQNLGQESLETAPCLIVMFERVCGVHPSRPQSGPVTSTFFACPCLS